MIIERRDSSIRKVASAALGGASIEWYDFFIYGTAAALVFPALFFPSTMPPLVAQLAAFSTFAIGFIARPLGGALFGHFGDRSGRKKALVVALILMGVATCLIGVLPTYAQVGSLAPIGLVFLRLIQGLALGGQWGGAVLLVTESAPEGKRGFYGAFAQAGVPVGVVLANLMFLVIVKLVSPEAFQAWGWRIPFLLSGALVALAIYVQFRLEESPAYKELASGRSSETATKPRSPIVAVLLKFPSRILLAGAAFVAMNACFYIMITFAMSYGTIELGFDRSALLMAVLIGSVFMIPALFVAAAWSDRWGRIGVYAIGAVLSGIWAFAFFPLLQTGVE